MSSNPTIPAGQVERAQPETFRARTLSNALTVKDIQASLAWYTEVMRFVVDQKYERDGELRGVILIAGSVRIQLNQDDGAKGWDRVKGEGLSLYFTTAQDVDKIAQRIKDQGGTLETEPADTPWGTRSFGLRDPDGFKLVISSSNTE